MAQKCAVWMPDNSGDTCGVAECPLSTNQLDALNASNSPSAANPYQVGLLQYAFTDGDASPSVIGLSSCAVFTCGNTAATNITTFDDGLNGQIIEIHFTSGNTTLVDGASLKLAYSVDYTPTINSVITLRRRSSIWYEVSRSPGAAWFDPLGDNLCVWAAYQPVGAVSFAESLIDLSGNGNDAVDPGGAATPTWDAVNGWTFDGGADCLATAFVPQNDQSQTILIQFTDFVDGWIAGASAGAGRQFGGYPGWAGSYSYANGGSASAAGGYAAGNFCIAGNQGYRNGVSHGAAIGAWGGASALPVYIGCFNDGAPAAWGDVRIRALSIYDCTLTAAQVLAIATAMAAL